jgi:CheY-specific phosphatase CheX
MSHVEPVNRVPQPSRPIPGIILEAIDSSVGAIFSTFLKHRPTVVDCPHGGESTDCVAGIISILGPKKWTIMLLIPRPTAVPLIEKFCTYRIEYDDPDLGDAVGELLSVMAGVIVDELGKLGYESQLSLPTVLPIRSQELLSEVGRETSLLTYETEFGIFQVRVVSSGSVFILPAASCSTTA